jgi:hypothetical protein
MTEAERARERAMTLGILTGLLLAATMVGSGIGSHSLTLSADSVRAVLLTSLDCFVLVVLRRIHAGSFSGLSMGAASWSISSICWLPPALLVPSAVSARRSRRSSDFRSRSPSRP